MSQALQEQEVTIGAWGNDLTLVLRPSGVAVLTIDTRGSANALSSEVLMHFAQALDCIEQEDSVKAVIFASGKKDLFIVGADIREIHRTTDRDVSERLASLGVRSFDKVLNSKKPIVAAINGLCLGGGLELTLCCDSRIASATAETMLGLPEVSIGLVPGLGGTQRLPRLIGLKLALEMILSSEPINVDQALACGLIDKAVEPSSLLEECEKKALELLQTKFDRQEHFARLDRENEEKDGGLKKRQSMLKMWDRVLRIKAKGQYPAPPRAIEVIEKGLTDGLEAGLKAELAAFCDLSVSPISKHLITLYMNKELASQMAIRAMNNAGKVTTIGIIGSGTMGTSIAELALLHNIDVVLKGSQPEKARVQTERLNKKLEVIKNESSVLPDKVQTAKASVAETDDDLCTAQLIVENVYEDLDLKNKVMYETSRAVTANCIIASNTSSFAISNLSQFSNKPERVVGLHFFSPVDRMPLVEVITHERTDDKIHKRAMAFVGQLGKVPVSVKDSPGFLVNRLLSMYLLESSRIGGEGVPLNWVDDAAVNFGMPLGPYSLFDELGWKMCIMVNDLMHEKCGPRYLLPEVMHRAVALGYEGKKGGQGFFSYDEHGKKIGLNPGFLAGTFTVGSDEKPDEATAQLLCDRLFFPVIDEAARILEEKIVRKPKDIDLAMVYGAAFPPFRGGLLKYADDIGLDYVVERLEEIYSKYEPKGRTISNMLLTLKKEGRRFYGLSQSN